MVFVYQNIKFNKHFVNKANCKTKTKFNKHLVNKANFTLNEMSFALSLTWTDLLSTTIFS